jgi:GT2 family glycosyltransferase/SAM-dependent methyltransferase
MPMAADAASLLSLLPPSARRVLDIGCAAAGFGAAIKARGVAEVVGIAADEEVARPARAAVDQVLVGDIEAADLSCPDGYFDAVVCGDRLPCWRDPLPLLRRLRRWLAPGGKVLARVPNARHHRVLAALLGGQWACPGRQDGAPRPLRFFTRREIEKLFYRAGFGIEVLQTVPGPGDDGWQTQAAAGRVSVDGLNIGGLPPGEAEEFHAAHYLVRATPVPREDHGLTSIVILVHNQLDYTRLCLDSIRHYTDEPHDLIVVDNAAFLACQRDVRVLTNPENRGFPAAANQGIQAAAGRQVLLLNNDTLVTTGWLTRLLRALHSDARVGLAGPSSNMVSGEQQVAVSYEDLDGLDGFAWDWGQAHNRRWEKTDRLVGFCLLIRREVIDAVGLLDERFGVGCYEDDDYCRRALGAGFRAVLARDAFVHHFGGRTFVGAGVDFRAVMKKNAQLFRDKWEQESKAPAPGSPSPAAEPPRPAEPYRLRMAPGGGLRVERGRLLLSACIIARDNARIIEACITSIRRHVDEVVLVDTGSKDDTPAIAARLGARVFHFPWCDDFSAARNESLRHARGRWIFWMDTDDVIDEANGRKLRALAERDDPAVMGYQMQVHCPGPLGADEDDFTTVDHVKLFRNLPQLRFDGLIHEQILGAINRAGGAVADTDVFVVHAHYDHSPAGQKRKLERDLRILHKELKVRPTHPFTLFNLGMTCNDCGQHAEAVRYLQVSLTHSGPRDSHLRKVYALLLSSQAQLGQWPAAWDTCEAGLRLFPKDAELLFRKALLLQEAGRLEEAVRAYRHLLETDEGQHFKSVVWGLRGFKGRHNLALVYQDLGQWDRAEEQWRLVAEEAPRYRAGWRGLGEVLLRQGKTPEALRLAERLLGDRRLRGEGVILQVRALAALGDLPRAWGEVRRAAQECPGELEPLDALCRSLFEAGNWPEAERALQELVRQNPADPHAHYNLGVVYQRPPAASGSGSTWPGPCTATRGCCCSTRPPVPWTA